MTMCFNPEAVRRVLRQANVAFADVAAKSLLVIPMSPGYAPHTPWAQAFADPRSAKAACRSCCRSATQSILPRSARLQFGKASWQDIEPAASRVHATEAWLALAEPGTGHITIKLKRSARAPRPPFPTSTYGPAQDTAAQAYASAANAAAAASSMHGKRIRSSISARRRNSWPRCM